MGREELESRSQRYTARVRCGPVWTTIDTCTPHVYLFRTKFMYVWVHFASLRCTNEYCFAMALRVAR